MANSSTAPPTTPAAARLLVSSSSTPATGRRQQQHQQPSPSSNSLSSSPVTTVQRAGSPSRPRSQPTAALAAAGAATAAPVETGAPNQATSARTSTADDSVSSAPQRRTRPSVAHNRSHSISGAKEEGVGILDPWILSTNSRKSSAGNERASLARVVGIEISGRVLNSLSPSRKHASAKSKPPASAAASNSTTKRTTHQVHLDILPPIILEPSFAQEANVVEPSSRKGSTASIRLSPKAAQQPLQDLSGKSSFSSPVKKKPTPSAKKTTSERAQISPEGTAPVFQTPRWEPTQRQKESKRVSVRVETEARVSTVNPGKNKQPSQKAMLSKALQKANTAVLLDNAQNYEGAVEAYGDACDLLQQVMVRTSGEEEKRKLQAIRSTYTRRIVELKGLAPQFKAEEKALPARPEANELYDPDDLDNYNADTDTQSLGENEDDDTIIETATVTRIINDQSYIAEPKNRTLSPSLVPPRRESLQTSAHSREQYIPPSPTRQLYQQQLYPRATMGEQMLEINGHIPSPMMADYMPPPLSLRRATSPMKVDQKQTGLASPTNSSISSRGKDHSRANSTESTSWLDTIDESGGSSAASSIHSRSSSRVLRRKRLRATSGATADEFDAALDAAVEAAYDQGYVPASDADLIENDVISIARKNVEIAKERVREAEKESAIQLAKERERRRLQENPPLMARLRARSDSIEDVDYLEEEAEEEERLLEEMTRDYMIMDNFEFDLQSKSALPRESGSSGFSGRTWGSSIGSNFTTAGTSLQTVAEAPVIPSLPQQLQSRAPPVHPPPLGALPAPPIPTSTPPPRPPPTTAPPRPPSAAAPRPPSAAAPRPPSAAATRPPSAAAPRPPSAAAPRPPSAAAPRPPSSAAPRPPSAASTNNQAQGIRSRRLSGQNPKQLKVETTKAATALPGPLGGPSLLPPPKVPGDDAATAPKSASSVIPPMRPMVPSPIIRPPASATSTSQGMFRRESPQSSDPGFIDPIPPPTLSPGLSPLTRTMPQESDVTQSRTGSPGRLNNKTSAGSGHLRLAQSSSSLKNRNLSVSSPDGSEGSPSTPSHPFSSSGANTRRGHGQGAPPLPTPSSANAPGSLAAGVGIAYFDTDIHSPYSPGSPNPMALNAPIPLEPCPSEFLLRPYWLMRCFYQTIVHSRGGYLSTKLFVPRDVWRVKGVKIKGMDEKISACDLLTAALLKLAKVDTDDADAVLEEMQALENILDQVQASLTKKLGSEVGVHGSQSMFKEAASESMDTTGPKSATSSSKSYLSWKRLRSKNSSAGLTSSYSAKENSKDGFSMSTLPMASAPVGRIPKRNIENAQFGGPNAHYLSSLARLFDAAQVLDQVARQVEDPGLRHSSQTQVGLDLSTRHASEFFGFYICRFVLSDVSVLLDKFIKQGSEWVLV